MRAQQISAELREDAVREPRLGDLRFRSLLSEKSWAALPLAVRRRFSKRVSRGSTVVYVGEILETEMNLPGWMLAQAARLIGAPFPLARNVHAPSVVTVTEDVASQGQIWTRLYARTSGFPQIVNSCKRFEGSTGLEEYVGYGIGMALTVHVRDEALIFRSQNYFVQIFGRRFTLPRWLTPGDIFVTHAEAGEGKFSFVLEVIHPRLGMLIRQLAIFREV